MPVHLNNILVVFLEGCKTHVSISATTFLMSNIARRWYYARVIFFSPKNLKEKRIKISIWKQLVSLTSVTLVLIILRLMRLNFRFKAQYMNGFQKLLLSAIHVIMKSTAGGICIHGKCVIKHIVLVYFTIGIYLFYIYKKTYFCACTRSDNFLNCPRSYGYYKA